MNTRDKNYTLGAIRLRMEQVDASPIRVNAVLIAIENRVLRLRDRKIVSGMPPESVGTRMPPESVGTLSLPKRTHSGTASH